SMVSVREEQNQENDSPASRMCWQNCLTFSLFEVRLSWIKPKARIPQLSRSQRISERSRSGDLTRYLRAKKRDVLQKLQSNGQRRPASISMKRSTPLAK